MSFEFWNKLSFKAKLIAIGASIGAALLILHKFLGIFSSNKIRNKGLDLIEAHYLPHIEKTQTELHDAQIELGREHALVKQATVNVINAKAPLAKKYTSSGLSTAEIADRLNKLKI